MISDILGGALADFIGVTIVLFGGASFLTGQALASTWRPAWGRESVFQLVVVRGAVDIALGIRD
jgi:hypothetical protein